MGNDYKSNYFGQDFDDAVAWIKSNATRVLQQITSLTAKVGDLSKLLTKNKTSAVDAINEIYTQGGGSGRVDTEMSDTSTNAVQNKVIKSYVDDAFDKTNILNVGMQDEVDSHFDNYSVVNIMDGTDIVATILMNTHSSGTKGIIFQHGSGWRIVTEELGDIIGAGWSQVLEDMDSKSTPIGEGGGGVDEETFQKLLDSMSPDLVWIDSNGVIQEKKQSYLTNNTFDANATNPLDVKVFLKGNFSSSTNGANFLFRGQPIEEIDSILNWRMAYKVADSYVSNIFNSCTLLKKVKLLNCEKVGTSWFHGCTSLKEVYMPDLRSIDATIENVPIEIFDCPKLEILNGRIQALNIKEWYIPKATIKYLTSMFYLCKELQRIEFHSIDANATYGNQMMFSQCTKLTDVKVNGLISHSVTFKDCPLNIESARSIINALDILNASTLTLSTYTKGLLTQSDRNQITNKGWTLA